MEITKAHKDIWRVMDAFIIWTVVRYHKYVHTSKLIKL